MANRWSGSRLDAQLTLDWQKSRGTTDSEIAELIGHGFVEISIANGHDAIAKVTQAEARIQIGVLWV